MRYFRISQNIKNGFRVVSFLGLAMLSQQSMAAVSDWFATQVNSSGSVASILDIATPMQSTSEVLRTYIRDKMLMPL